MNTYPCPVCEEPAKQETDYIDYILMEDCSTCEHCLLFQHQYMTGQRYERNGWCEEGWSWDDYTGTLDRTRIALAEAQTLHKHPDWPQWKGTLTTTPSEDPNLFLAFSDWLQEQGLELQAEAVRGLVKGVQEIEQSNT